MSSSDIDSIKNEDLDSLNTKDPKKFKLEKRKIMIQANEEADDYDTDSAVFLYDLTSLGS